MRGLRVSWAALSDRARSLSTASRFQSLATAGLLSEETARSLGSLTALRNRIAHAYGDLDPVRMVAEAPAGLAQVERLIEELDRTIAEAP